MRERSNMQHCLTWQYLIDIGAILQTHRHQVPVRKHGPFGRTRCSAGIKNPCQVIRVFIDADNWSMLDVAFVLEVIDTQDFVMIESARELLMQSCIERLAGENNARTTITRDRFDFFWMQFGIDGNRTVAGSPGCK